MEKDRLITCNILVIGGSAGSLVVLLKVLPALRTDLKFPVIIVLHRKAGNDSELADLLNAKTDLKVKEAEDKEPLLPGTIYIAPGDYHLLVENNFSLSLDCSEKINFSRPSIDATFETAAEACFEKTVAVLLSGASSDGVTGLARVHDAGGTTIVQDPQDAEFSFMPVYAVNNVVVDLIVKGSELAAVINSFVQ